MRAVSMIATAAIAATSALAVTVTGGNAADGADAFARRMFAGPIGAQKAEACFVRHYDANHLAHHKRQKVADMKLLVTAENLPEDEGLNYSYRASIRLRNRAADFDSDGECGHARIAEDAGVRPQLGCETGCEGGGLRIEIADDNRSAIVRLGRIVISPHGKSERERTLEGGADDRVLRLDRASLKDCAPLMTGRDEVAALRRK
jgi:hypothetical protein